MTVCGTDGNLSQGIQNHIIPDPGVIANAQLPGVGDHYGRPDQHIATDLSAKYPKKKPAPAIQYLGRGAEKKPLHQPPKLDIPSGTTAKPFGDAGIGADPGNDWPGMDDFDLVTYQRVPLS